MHELSIALSIVEMATEEARRQGGSQVEAVYLRVGHLSGVARDALLFSFEMACEDTPLAGARLIIEDVPVAIYCPVCLKEQTLDSIRLCCPVCKALTPQVVRGKELEVTALEIQ